MTYKNNYIGKGKRNEKLENIVKFTFSLEDLQAVAYEYEGKMYVSVETSEMKNPDKFGRTHTAWVAEKAESKVEEPAPTKSVRRKSKSKE
jgi:hypothetical protein